MSSLDKYVELVEFMGLVFGKNFEIILHDVSKPESSVIAIVNSHITGRCVGSPMTDLALQVMEGKEYKTKNYIANYEGKTKDGKVHVSSTFFIKENEELIGMICVNHDVQDLLELDRVLGNLKNKFHLLDTGNGGNGYSEILDGSITCYSNNLINSTISALPISPKRISVKERISIIWQLDQQGIFSTRGAVSQMAKYFDTSESTIYRYISKARKQYHSDQDDNGSE